MRPKARVRADVVSRTLMEMNQPQKWLIKQVKTTSGYMSQLLSGTRNPSPEMRRRLMSVLNFKKFNELFTIEREK